MTYKELIRELTGEFTAFGAVVKDKFTELTKKVDSNKSELEVLIEKFGALPEPYNDTGLRDELADLIEKIEGIKDYDDADLRKELEDTSLAVYEDLHSTKGKVETLMEEFEAKMSDMLKDFAARQEVILDEVSKRVTYEVSEIKQFDGEPLDAGTFVKFDNALWFNKLDGNDSIPAVRNYSYDQIIAAPKAPEHKGLFQEDADYEYNDIVMKDNASWIAIKGKPGDLPGEGWKLLAKGIRGRKGEKGDKGDAGDTVKVEFDVEKSLEDLNDRLMIVEASDVKEK